MTEHDHPNASQSLQSAFDANDGAAILDALLELEEADIEALRDVLLQLLASHDESLRATTLYVLGKVAPIGDPEFGNQMIRLLGDEHDQVRVEAAQALYLLEYAPAFSALSNALLHDPDGLVRVCAAEALGKVLSHAPNEITSALINALHDEDGLVRGYTADSLSHADPTLAIAPIQEVLEQESNPYYRAWLLQALVRLGETLQITSLLDTLRVSEDIYADAESDWAILFGVMQNFLRDIATPETRDEIEAHLQRIGQEHPYLRESMEALEAHVAEIIAHS